MKAGGLFGGGADFFGEAVEGDAFGAGDAAFVGVVLPWREDEKAALSDGIKKGIGRLEKLTEAVIGEEDDEAVFLEEDREDVLLVGGDKRRDHDRAISGGFDAIVHIVAEGLVVAGFGFINEVVTDMDGLAVFFREEEDIADGIVHAPVDLDIVLDAEETGFEALGGKAGGVHLDIANHRLELVVGGHRAEERLVPLATGVSSQVWEKIALDALDSLQIAADYFDDAHWKRSGDMDDGVEVVGHQAEL